MTQSPPRILSRFSEPLGYVPEEDSFVVESGKTAKKFLNMLLSKLQTTVTVLTTPGSFLRQTSTIICSEYRRKMFFTDRKEWFVVEETFEPENGSLYVDAVLANRFLEHLLIIIGDSGHARKILTGKEGNLNVLADHIATVLQPFLQPDFAGDAALMKTIWAYFRPMCEEAIKLQIEGDEVKKELRQARDYVGLPSSQNPVTIRLFDSGDFRWPFNFGKIPISSSAMSNSPFIPMHIQHFLSAFSSRLNQSFSIERVEATARTEFDHKHREKIVMSVYNWSWIVAIVLELQLSDNHDERRRQLQLFEADMALEMYATLVQRTCIPQDLVKKLEMAEKSAVMDLAEDVVSLLIKYRDFEFKFDTKAWESVEWKKVTKKFWKEGRAGERNNNRRKTEEARVDRLPAGSEVIVKNELSLSPPESISEKDEYSQNSQLIEGDLCNLTTTARKQDKLEFDIMTLENSIECRLSMTEIDDVDFEGIESQRQFVNRILATLGAELVLKADTNEDLMYQTDLHTNIYDRILEQGLQSLVKSFEQRMLISPADAKLLFSGAEATKGMIASVVEECDGSQM